MGAVPNMDAALPVWGRLAIALFGGTVFAVEGEPVLPMAPGMPAPVPVALPGYETGETPSLRSSTVLDNALFTPSGNTSGVSRPIAQSPRRDTDLGLTVQRRRWRSLSPVAAGQPPTWGFSQPVPFQVSLGLQGEVFYTDNIASEPNDRAQGGTVLELSPIIRLDVGDVPLEGSPASRLTEYYGTLLYVPTLHYLVDEDETQHLQHVFSQVGRSTETSHLSLRVDYDERIVSSSDDTSPEDTYTVFEVSPAFDYYLTPKTRLRTRLSWRDITVADGISNRTTWTGEAGLEWAATPKTTLGLGTEVGRLDFEQEEAGRQDYAQLLVVWRWRPTAKLNLYSRAGVERREFDKTPPKGTQFSPVAAAAVQWLATEQTRVSARFRVGNEPSIVENGALFQDIRFGTEVQHDLSTHWYVAGEFQLIGRDYDTGRRETEPATRLTLGFRENPDPSANHLHVELYLHWRQRQRHDEPETADRTQVGLQVTKYF